MTGFACVDQACSTDMSWRGIEQDVVVTGCRRVRPWVQGGHPHARCARRRTLDLVHGAEKERKQLVLAVHEGSSVCELR